MSNRSTQLSQKLRRPGHLSESFIRVSHPSHCRVVEPPPPQLSQKLHRPSNLSESFIRVVNPSHRNDCRTAPRSCRRTAAPPGSFNRSPESFIRVNQSESLIRVTTRPEQRWSNRSTQLSPKLHRPSHLSESAASVTRMTDSDKRLG